MSNPSPERHETEASPPLSAPSVACEPPHASVGHAARLGIVGLVAALMAWVAIGQTGEVFQLPPELAKLGKGYIPGADEQKQIGAGNVVLYYKHSSLWIGIAGGIAGGLFGLTLGMMRRSSAAILLGTLGGILLGGAFGAAGGPLAVYIGETTIAKLRQSGQSIPEQYSMMMHGATWLLVGLGVGLGTGLGATRKRFGFSLGSMLIAAIAGAFGGALYPFVVAVTMPAVDVSMSIPKGDLNRLVWLGLPGVLMGLALGRRG